MKKSFSLIELIIIIIIVGVLYSSITFSLANTNLNQAADQIISHINYTRHLALKDNKMQYYPINNTKTEMNRSKYWFKQWWQIRFTRNKNNPKDLWYEIFTDLSYDSNNTNFDGTGHYPNNTTSYELTFAKNPNTQKYLTGRCGSSGYPNCIDIDKKLNLTNAYNINRIKVEGITNYNITFNKNLKLLFDNYGNVYLSEGKKGDKGDINPYDKDERIPLLQTAKIVLCSDESCEENISICISAKIGSAYICK